MMGNLLSHHYYVLDPMYYFMHFLFLFGIYLLNYSMHVLFVSGVDRAVVYMTNSENNSCMFVHVCALFAASAGLLVSYLINSFADFRVIIWYAWSAPCYRHMLYSPAFWARDIWGLLKIQLSSVATFLASLAIYYLVTY